MCRAAREESGISPLDGKNGVTLPRSPWAARECNRYVKTLQQAAMNEATKQRRPNLKATTYEVTPIWESLPQAWGRKCQHSWPSALRTGTTRFLEVCIKKSVAARKFVRALSGNGVGTNHLAVVPPWHPCHSNTCSRVSACSGDTLARFHLAVVVVLTSTRLIKSVATEQAPSSQCGECKNTLLIIATFLTSRYYVLMYSTISNRVYSGRSVTHR